MVRRAVKSTLKKCAHAWKRIIELRLTGIDSFSHCSRCFEMTSLNLFKEMKERSFVGGPDICMYNTLIHMFCLVGRVKDALVMWEELKVSGHEPDNSTYRVLIQGCYVMLKARKVTEACQLFEKMVQEGVRASCWTYNILIDGLFRNGRSEAGFTLFCDLKKKGQFVDGITFSIVVLQLCREGKLDGAVKLVKETEARGFFVDLVTISSLLMGFHKQGRWDWKEKLKKHVKGRELGA